MKRSFYRSAQKTNVCLVLDLYFIQVYDFGMHLFHLRTSLFFISNDNVYFSG